MFGKDGISGKDGIDGKLGSCGNGIVGKDGKGGNFGILKGIRGILINPSVPANFASGKDTFGMIKLFTFSFILDKAASMGAVALSKTFWKPSVIFSN
jgi:hypothetical protein